MEVLTLSTGLAMQWQKYTKKVGKAADCRMTTVNPFNSPLFSVTLSGGTRKTFIHSIPTFVGIII